MQYIALKNEWFFIYLWSSSSKGGQYRLDTGLTTQPKLLKIHIWNKLNEMGYNWLYFQLQKEFF